MEETKEMITGPRLMFYGANDPYFKAIVQRLINDGVHLRIVVGQDDDPHLPENTKFIHPKKFLSLEFFEDFARQTPFVLSQKILDGLLDCENEFLAITDRLTIKGVSVRERKLFYRNVLLYWWAVLKENPVDVVFFTCLPHMGPDFILYHLAKYLNIPVFFLDYAGLDQIVFFTEDYKDIEKVPEDYMSGSTREEIENTIDPFILERLFKESHYVKAANFWKNFSVINQNLRILLSSYKFWKYFRVFDLSDCTFQGPITMMNMVFKHKMVDIKSIFLKAHYNKLAVTADCDQKYIYFPLHFQPEYTTLPGSGVFESHFLAIEILSKSLPAGWKIYVKEHPAQYKLIRLNTLNFRDKKFYDRLASWDNVSLIDQSISSKELISKSQAVAVLTGTVGWEALQMGKPCLSFGFPWYGGCRSCFLVNSKEGVQQVLAEIKDKSSADVKLDMFKFYSYYQKYFLFAARSDQYAKKYGGDYDKMIDILTKAIASKIRTYAEQEERENVNVK